MKAKPILDFFSNRIEVGDRFIYWASYPVPGRVVKIKITGIEIEYFSKQNNTSEIMKCKSPHMGVCIDKIPEF